MKIKNCAYDNLQLADRFLSLAEKFMPYAKNEQCILDMGEGRVIQHSCKTIACHGGYACLIFGLKSKKYTTGAHKIAEYLGFKSRHSLKDWAHNNSEIWGNEDGYHMFSLNCAFDCSVFNKETLKDVVSHYIGVAERLMNMGDGNHV